MSKWALVTGAARRIGRTIALDLASQGWDIVIHYHRSATEAQNLAEEIQALGQEACLAEIDLADPALTEKLIPSLSEEIGLITALVNNAALFDPDETDPGGARHWAINTDAPRLLSKTFREQLPNNRRGVIVNLLDATPHAANFAAYGRSKQALSEMTKNLAKSFAPYVRVNAVAPAYVLPSPRQTEAAFLKLAGDKLVTPQQVATAVRQLIETTTATGQIVTVT